MIFKTFAYILLSVVLFQQGLYGQSTNQKEKIALLVSDNYSKPVADAIALLKKDKEFSARFDVYTSKDAESQIEEVKIAICYVHTGQVLERYSEKLRTVVTNGGFVYAVGETAAAQEYQAWGMRFDSEVAHYFDHPSPQNIYQLVLHLTNKHLGTTFHDSQPIVYPNEGIVNWQSGKIYTDFEKFQASENLNSQSGPWISLYTFRYEVVTDQIDYLKDYAAEITKSGFRVMILFGYPLDVPIEKFCLGPSGQSRIDVLVNFSSIPGGSPDQIAKSFGKLGVPVINAINLTQSKYEWDKNQTGIPIANRTLNLTRPEIMGQIQPTVVTTQEVKQDPNGFSYSEKVVLKDRVPNLIAKIEAWSALRHTLNAEKDITMIYYNGQPGKNNIGASYLNVLPNSMFSILSALKSKGYDVGKKMIDQQKIFDQVISGGRNIGTWAPHELDRLVKQDHPILVDVETYKKWFNKLNPKFQQQVIQKWGPADSAKIMVWKDEKRKSYFVLPQVSYGKIHLMPQPARAWQENEQALFHDMNLPPHHQYIAFYLYLQNQLKPNALIHLGTHGTLEWLSGREAGADSRDPWDGLIGGMVNIYPYIMDNVGEGTQAKRRGNAVIIDHMTPAFQEAGLRPELKKLAGLINDYDLALDKSPVAATAYLKEINQLLVENNLNRDLNLEGELKPDDIQSLEHYLQEINENLIPMGMHTFGVSPDSSQGMLTATAMVNRLKDISPMERERLLQVYFKNLVNSGPEEINGLLDALDGKYIKPAAGNDPLRNPDALPTGKNFYGFDPSRMPSKGIYQEGEKLADDLIDTYKRNHNGQYPDKVAFNLWSVETLRHEGIMESQILSLLGVKLKYDGFGKVNGVELINRDQLDRPRIDVVVTPSGLYRDMFPHFMQLIDQAVSLAYQSTESDNAIRNHVDQNIEYLKNQGINDHNLRKKLAMVRMFSSESGSYGLGVDQVAQSSDKWDDNKEIADVYFNRSSHLYGQGFWGESNEQITTATGKDMALSIFKKALSGTKAVVHSRSTNVYGVLDNDDFYQYVGGMTLAIKQIDGTEPDILISNLTEADNMRQETLDRFIGRELTSRYFNPNWINKMMDEGYAGARMIGQITDNMWGWQATTDKAIRSEDWQEWTNVYVNDKYGLDIREKFSKSGNLYAYQQMLARMMEVVRKGKWTPDEETLKALMDAYLETVEQTGLTCSDQVCGNEKLVEYMEKKATSDMQKGALAKLNVALAVIHHQSSAPTKNLKSDHFEKLKSNLPKDPIIKSNNSNITKQKYQNPSRDNSAKQTSDGANTNGIKGFKMEEGTILNLAKKTEEKSVNNSLVLAILLGIIACGMLYKSRIS